MFLCLLLSKTRIFSKVHYLFDWMIQIDQYCLFWLNSNSFYSRNLENVFIKLEFSMKDPKFFKISNLFMAPKIPNYFQFYFYSPMKPNRFFVEQESDFFFLLYCENLYHCNLFSKVYFINCFIYLNLGQQLQINFSAKLYFFCHTQKFYSKKNQNRNFQQKYMFHFSLHKFSSLLIIYVKIIVDLVNLLSYLNFPIYHRLHFYYQNDTFKCLILI